MRAITLVVISFIIFIINSMQVARQMTEQSGSLKQFSKTLNCFEHSIKRNLYLNVIISHCHLTDLEADICLCLHQLYLYWNMFRLEPVIDSWLG